MVSEKRIDVALGMVLTLLVVAFLTSEAVVYTSYRLAAVLKATSTPSHVADGNWQISVQVPSCDTSVQVILPEREGDVVTLYCKNMPVKTESK